MIRSRQVGLILSGFKFFPHEMNSETRDRFMKVVAFSKKIIHIGFIPFIIYLGMTRSVPTPSLLKLLSPLAQ
jgi:mitochondrial import receptor subunit TOM7